MSCLFHKMTGLYCPGCGGTRAFLFLIHGHPLLSLWYHPFVIYALVVMGYYAVSAIVQTVRGRKIHLRTWPLWGALIVIAANCIAKNAILLITGIRPI